MKEQFKVILDYGFDIMTGLVMVAILISIFLTGLIGLSWAIWTVLVERILKHYRVYRGVLTYLINKKVIDELIEEKKRTTKGTRESYRWYHVDALLKKQKGGMEG